MKTTSVPTDTVLADKQHGDQRQRGQQHADLPEPLLPHLQPDGFGRRGGFNHLHLEQIRLQRQCLLKVSLLLAERVAPQGDVELQCGRVNRVEGGVGLDAENVGVPVACWQGQQRQQHPVVEVHVV